MLAPRFNLGRLCCAGASLGKFCNDVLASQSHRRQMRANQFSTSELIAVNAIAPTSSFAAEHASSYDAIADAPTSSFFNGDADAPTASFIF
jgi:hypothetical protein